MEKIEQLFCQDCNGKIDELDAWCKHYGEVIDEINKINKKKDAVIMKRLSELGIDTDIESEKRRRFKRFVVEHSYTEETYWYNDGSESGLRIITFKKWQPNYDMKNPNNTITCEVADLSSCKELK